MSSNIFIELCRIFNRVVFKLAWLTVMTVTFLKVIWNCSRHCEQLGNSSITFPLYERMNWSHMCLAWSVKFVFIPNFTKSYKAMVNVYFCQMSLIPKRLGRILGKCFLISRGIRIVASTVHSDRWTWLVFMSSQSKAKIDNLQKSHHWIATWARMLLMFYFAPVTLSTLWTGSTQSNAVLF